MTDTQDTPQRQSAQTAQAGQASDLAPGGHSASPAIELEHLDVRLNGVTALDDITLSVRAGEFLALLGPNGSGKTTLLRVVTGVLAPDGGAARVFGESTKRLGRLRRRIGYLPQAGVLDRRFPVTAAEAVMMGRYARIGFGRRPGAADREAVAEALRRVDAADLADRPIARLSGGQRQRVFLARALVNQPKLLVLDEPTSAMDTEAEERVYALLQDLHRKGATIVIATHDIAAVSTYVDRVACLNRRLVAHGRPDSVMSEDVFEAMYGCHSMFFAHGGSPHMVVGKHE